MKNLFTALFIIFCLSFASCNNDDNDVCTTVYSGTTIKDGLKYYVSYYDRANGGKLERVRVPEEVYTWIMRGHLKNGDCFDVEKYRYVE